MQDRIAVVGAGLIGRSWCISFARSGLDVALFEPQSGAAKAAHSLLASSLDDLEKQGLLGKRSAQQVLSHIRIAASLPEALDAATHVQECAPESLQIKQKLFLDMDGVAKADAVLCSSTSALLPSAFTAGLAGRHRCLVGHPVNPPHLVQAVELVPAPWTNPEIVQRTRALMLSVGQAPIALQREVDGFVVNRLQGALLQEAFRLVSAGYASTQDIDTSISKGLGRRWALMGPFETIDLNAPGGVTDYIIRFEEMYRTIAKTQSQPVAWSGELAERIGVQRSEALARDRLAERQNWRDRRLMALTLHLQHAEEKYGS